MVQATVPGERWEIEFFSDRPVEIEVFTSDGTLSGEARLASFFSNFDS